MVTRSAPLLIKRYASRRLYNTETSDYVTLDDIAGFIREGREVKIVDLKSGDELTRQYLLQIIAEHEGRGENVLPIDVLTDLVRSYTTSAQSVVPQFLAASFETLREGREVPRDLYPLLVTFTDIDDPASVLKVDPDNLAASFGPGVALKRITLEITDENVTKGKVETVLGWLDDYYGSKFDGQRYETINAENRLANSLSASNFDTEN